MGDEVRELPKSIFAKCSGLLKVNLSNKLEIIAYSAFSGCTSLKEMSFPRTVTEIHENAFNSCSNLLTIKSYIKEPFTTKAFSWSPTLSKGTLYIPSGTLEKYKTYEQWRYFPNIIEFVSLDPIEDATTVNAASLNGQDLSNNVVNEIYYNVGDGSCDLTDGSIVISQTTDMTKIENLEPGSTDIKENFTGMILKVGKGKGLVTVKSMTVGNAQLMMQIGNNTPMLASRTEKTYISTSSNSTRAPLSNEVRIYGITVKPGDYTGISDIRVNSNDETQIYSLSGQRSSVPRKGINIIGNRKIMVK